jgi:hypothetical protein
MGALAQETHMITLDVSRQLDITAEDGSDVDLFGGRAARFSSDTPR